jgi:hypothetical protein
MPSARWFSWASVLKMGIIKVTGKPIKDMRSKGVCKNEQQYGVPNILIEIFTGFV